MLSVSKAISTLCLIVPIFTRNKYFFTPLVSNYRTSLFRLCYIHVSNFYSPASSACQM